MSEKPQKLSWRYKDIEIHWEHPWSADWLTAEIALEKGFDKEIRFEVYAISVAGNIHIGWFSMSTLPGCCGIVISHASFVRELYRGTEASRQFREVKTEVAKRAGYSCMIATTQIENIPSYKNMIKSGYRIVEEFKNKRTGNRLGIGIKLL